MLSNILINSTLSVLKKLPILKLANDDTTNHNYHPIKNQHEQSLNMVDGRLNNALRRGEKEGWGKKIRRSIFKEHSSASTTESSLEFGSREKSSHKVDVISHNTLVTRGFFGFSQNRFAEDLICDGMEIDLNYSKDGKLIASHGKQSYFGIINPFASAVRVEAFAKLMPAILKRNQSSSNKRFKIIVDTTDIKESGKMLYDLIDIFSQNLTKEEIESIEFVAMEIGARDDAEKLVKAKYGNEIAYSLTCNHLHLIDIIKNSDEKDKLELKSHTLQSDKIVHAVSDFRDNPKPLVEILEKHPELKTPFQNMEKEHGAYLTLYPKSNMLISSTNSDVEAVYKLIEYGLKEVKFDKLPSIYDLPENERTFDDIVKYVKDARPFDNIGNRELRNKQRESGMPYQYHVSDIILTNIIAVSCLCMIKKACNLLGKHVDGATSNTRKVAFHTAHAAFFTSYTLCFAMHQLLLANAFADTEAGLALSVPLSTNGILYNESYNLFS